MRKKISKMMINATMNAKLPPFTMHPPKPPQCYLAAARYFFRDVEFLLKGGSDVVIAGAHLAAQSLECALKAYLSKRGISVQKLSHKPFGHNLKNLWLESVSKGLAITQQPPDWCLLLKQTHDRAYHLRYPLDIHGFSIPNLSEVVPEIRRLIEQVEAAIV